MQAAMGRWLPQLFYSLYLKGYLGTEKQTRRAGRRRDGSTTAKEIVVRL